jgi:hypothetical protein
MSIINESYIDEECIYVFSQNILVSTCNMLALFSASVLAGEPSAQGQHLCGENYRCIFLPVILFIVIFGTLVSILVIRNSLPETWSLADALSEDVELSAVTEVKETKDGIDT